MVEHNEPLDVEIVDDVEQTAHTDAADSSDDYIGRHRAPETDAA